MSDEFERSVLERDVATERLEAGAPIGEVNRMNGELVITLFAIDAISFPLHRKRTLGDVTGLAKSINELGLLHPITVTPSGTLVSGRHRVEACRLLKWNVIPAVVVTLNELHLELVEIDENLIRNELTALERAEHLKRRKDLYETLYPETKHGGDRKSSEAKSSGQDGHLKERFTKDTAAATGTSERTIRREVQIAERIPEDVRDALRDTPAADNQADLLKLSKLKPEQQQEVVEQIKSGKAESLKDATAIIANEKRVQNLADISANSAPLDDGSKPVPVVLVDPPWEYDFEPVDAWSNDNHYPSMSMAELLALPVPTRATPDAILFLWATSPKLADAMALLAAWGFTYKTCAVWDKEWSGRGYYFRQQHELLLVATRGDFPSVPKEQRPASVIREKRGQHSAKPALVYEVIEQMYPTLPKLELFARGAGRPGWSTWGNQAESPAAEEKGERPGRGQEEQRTITVRDPNDGETKTFTGARATTKRDQRYGTIKRTAGNERITTVADRYGVKVDRHRKTGGFISGQGFPKTSRCNPGEHEPRSEDAARSPDPYLNCRHCGIVFCRFDNTEVVTDHEIKLHDGRCQHAHARDDLWHSHSQKKKAERPRTTDRQNKPPKRIHFTCATIVRIEDGDEITTVITNNNVEVLRGPKGGAFASSKNYRDVPPCDDGGHKLTQRAQASPYSFHNCRTCGLVFCRACNESVLTPTQYATHARSCKAPPNSKPRKPKKPHTASSPKAEWCKDDDCAAHAKQKAATHSKEAAAK
jgi:N6-adenosine-specific RNA methylase IME4